MTQASNLAKGGSNFNADGDLSLTTGVTGTLPVANGGTGQTTYTNGQLLIGNTTGNTLTKTTLTQGSGISITNGAGSITIAATGGGTVTSVATGNGLSGGTITTSGTLAIACPTLDTVGSYVFGQIDNSSDVGPGGTKAGGISYSGITAGSVLVGTGGLSGTWRCMGNSPAASQGSSMVTVWCRVS
jgi:hypothetical protein